MSKPNAHRIVLDTNRYSDVLARKSEAVRTVSEADEIYLPFVVLAELRTGFIKGNRRASNEAVLSQFMAQPGVHVLYADDQTVDVWAGMNANLLMKGRVLPHNDVWIASLCVQFGLALYSRDRHFDELPKVIRV